MSAKLRWLGVMLIMGSAYGAYQVLFTPKPPATSDAAVSFEGKDVNGPADTLVFPRRAIRKSRETEKVHNLERKNFSPKGRCWEKWENIVYNSTESLLVDISTGGLQFDDECGRFESENGMLGDIEAACISSKSGPPSRACEAEVEIYRARLIDEVIPDSVGYENMPYEVAVNKLLLIPHILKHDRSDILKFEKGVALADALIKDAPEIAVYRKIKLMNMALLSAWDQSRLSQEQWREFLKDYEMVYGWDAVLLASHIYSNEIWGQPDQNAPLIEWYTATRPGDCMGFYYLARQYWLNGEIDQAKDVAQKCREIDPDGKVTHKMNAFYRGEVGAPSFHFVDQDDKKIFFSPF